MGNNLYWVSALTYAFILAIIRINDSKYHNRTKIDKAYKTLTNWVIFFCLQDTIWGLCDSQIITKPEIFFFSSAVFHSATVITTYFWLKYILTFLGDKAKHQKGTLILDSLIILFQFTLIILNYFTPTIYSIVDGKYVPEYLRSIAFFNQYIVYLLIGITTLYCAIREKHQARKRFLTVFFFALTPILSGIFQLLYPNSPFYSMGYFLGCFIIHIFIVYKDQIEAEQGITLRAIANIYYTMHMLDLENNKVKIFLTSNIVSEYVNVDVEDTIQNLMINTMKATVTDKYLESTLKFVDFSTLNERIKGKSIISFEFIGKNHGWTRASFIPIETNNDGNLNKVMFATQIIDEEKTKELDLLFKSNSDQITGLLNRRAYEEDITTILDNPNKKDLVYVSIDVNGLKTVNDNLGHDAGDELIIGAANCLKQALGKFGEVYRTGGDEFISLLYADEKQLETAQKELDNTIASWSGNLVKKLSISCGYVPYKEHPDSSIREISKLADERMYQAKSDYYRINHIERRKY